MIPRHRTALERAEYSRPIRLGLADEIITAETTVLDYGCGRGSDVARLRAIGIQCEGWDPQHAPHGKLAACDVVNLGYVVNVIEDPEERCETLRAAWALTGRVLIVTARLTFEALGQKLDPFADGHLTTRGTFQKFYDHGELRDWLTEVLEARPVAGAPGTYYVFRSDADREYFLAKRQRRVSPTLRATRPETLCDTHRSLFDAVIPFFSARGRLPSVAEVPEAAELYRCVSRIETILSAMRHAVGADAFDRAVHGRREDLLVYLALSKFGRRPTLRKLPVDVQLDVLSFFPSYVIACRTADDLLLSVGKRTELDKAFKQASLGKCTGNALYVHVSCVSQLPMLLRLYEGCARACVGACEGATLVKLHRMRTRVSYLAYPEFDSNPHPSLESSVVVDLEHQSCHYLDYSDRTDPPVLHRKELFVAADYPGRDLFAALTRSEEKHKLLDEPSSIGTLKGWNSALARQSVELRGHRLVRRERIGL